MARTNPTAPLLLLTLGLVVVAGVFAMTVLDSNSRSQADSSTLYGQPGLDDAAPVRPREAVALVEPTLLRTTVNAWAGDCTVLWPVTVELRRLRSAYLPTEEGVNPIGTGADARLAGLIVNENERGVRATVRFVAGPNVGTELVCDANGAFGSERLYPGLNVVDVEGPSIPGSRREVRLRRNSEALLNLSYGRPAAVSGRVLDEKGEGLGGARVTFDGQQAFSGPDGGFYFPRVCAGACLVEIEATGRAAHREIVNVTSGSVVPLGRLTFTLQQETSMAISVRGGIGAEGPVQVFVLPGGDERTFPWYTKNPIEVWPGRPHIVRGLPAKVVKVSAFHGGAASPFKVVNLRPGRETPVTIELSPVPKITGTVTKGGEPVVGARVRLEAPDRVRATLGYFREPSWFLETDVLPMLPPAVQDVWTDARGRFTLTAWSELSPVRYLEAIGPAGRAMAGRLVHADEAVIDLELTDVDLFDSQLELTFPGRFQGVPVQVVRDGTPVEFLVDGRPTSPFVVGPYDTLTIEGLVTGTWSVDVKWYTTDVLSVSELEVAGRVELEVPLPMPAIEGQDEETWTRAGREFPLK